MTALCIVCLPLVLLAFPPYHATFESILWMLIASSISWGMICFPWRVWDKMKDAAPDADAMLTVTPPDERETLMRSFNVFVDWRNQLAVSTLGMVTLLVVICCLKGHVLKIYPYSIFTICAAGFLFGHSVYLIVVSSSICRNYGRLSRIAVPWISPIDTPGISKASRYMRSEALLGSVLLLMVAGPLIFVYVEDKTWWANTIFAIGFALPIVSIVVVGAISQYWLAKPIRRERLRILGELARPFGDDLPDDDFFSQSQNNEQLRLRLALYSQVARTPTSYLGADLISVYIAAVFSGTLPFVIAYVSSH